MSQARPEIRDSKQGRSKRTVIAIVAILVGLSALGMGDIEAEEPRNCRLDSVESAPAELGTVVVDEHDNAGAPLFFSVVDGLNGTGEWSEEMCRLLRSSLPASCMIFGESEDSDRLTLVREVRDHRYYVRLNRNSDGALKLEVNEWSRPGQQWQLFNSRLSFDGGNGADWARNTVEQNILDGPVGSTPSAELPPYYWRATGLLGTSIAIATWWYLSADEINTKDWDFGGLFTSDEDLRPQSEKWRNFGGWRFDDNEMYLNTPLHPMAGAGFHILARSNHLGFWGSVLAANLTNLVWEMGVEHHEVIALNDLVFTGIGGIPMGEAYYQIGQFFRRSEPTISNQILSWLFGAPLQFNDLIDDTGPIYLGGRDDLGWPSDIWHRFVLQSSVSTSSEQHSDLRRQDLEIGGEAEIVLLPDFRRRGTHDRWLAGPLATTLASSIASGDEGIYNWKLVGSMDLAGYYRQDIQGDLGLERGHSLFVGTGLAFRHIQHRYGNFLDRYGIVHLPGLSVDASWMTAPANFRLRYGFYPDMTNIDSRAYPVYEHRTGQTAGRTVLANEGYYHGWGLSSLLRLEADIAFLNLFWGWDFHFSRSIDRWDRFDYDEERFGENLDEYLSLTDIVSHQQAGALVTLPYSHIRIGFIGERRRREGILEEDGELWRGGNNEWRAMGVFQLHY